MENYMSISMREDIQRNCGSVGMELFEMMEVRLEEQKAGYSLSLDAKTMTFTIMGTSSLNIEKIEGIFHNVKTTQWDLRILNTKDMRGNYQVKMESWSEIQKIGFGASARFFVVRQK